eukprot:15195522-Heterocapsa_arctica.AAC.1
MPVRGATRSERDDPPMEELCMVSSCAMRNGNWHDDNMDEKHCGRGDAHACSPEFEFKKPGDRQAVARGIRSEVHQDDIR